MSDARIIVDYAIAVCKGCKGERKFYPDAPLVGADAIAAFLQAGVAPCPCGASHCDMKLHVKNPEVL